MSTEIAKWDRIVLSFHEIALKGGNRGPFLTRLYKNVKQALAAFDVTVEKLHDRIVVDPGKEDVDPVLARAAAVFGVSFATPVRLVEPDIKAMTAAAIGFYREQADRPATFAVRCRRNNKRFPMTSQEICCHVGAAVNIATGASVDLGHPDVTISYRIQQKQVYLERPRRDGPAGLPMGVTGNVLSLFSGGIDSPAAVWLIMRRGCVSDFVHFHVFPHAEPVRSSKITELIRILVEPQGRSTRLFLVPYHAFQLALLNVSVPQDLELVLFRRFMMRTANALAERQGLDALVTGDNLAQVASQTLENINALEGTTDRPVFRPVLAYDKNEIIELTQRIGTYEPSLADYKDCCSLVARHPQTRPKRDRVLRAEANLPVDKITEQAMEEMAVWTFKKGEWVDR